MLGNNTFVTEQENIFCVWQNFYDESEKITDINIDIFEEENGSYNRICEDFSERCYSRGELEAMLNSAGLKREAVFDEMTFDAPKSDSERIVYVVRRV